MSETYIEIKNLNPIDVFGREEEKLNVVRRHFPDIRIILRGNLLKAIGAPITLADWEEKMHHLIYHYEHFNRLNENDIESLFNAVEDLPSSTSILSMPSSETILIGSGGKRIKALTKNQQQLVQSCSNKDMVFAIGPAGSGKTYTAVALAVRALKNKEVKRIVLTRPAVEAGENLGFLPGDMKEKLDPYMQPLYDALKDMLPYQKLLYYLEESIIEIAPLAFMRGRTLDNAFVILDEAQNATESQMKMFLTRMGKSAKFVITGDITQIDLPGKQASGLLQASKILRSVAEIDFVELTEEDVVRHPIVTQVLKAYQNQAK